MMQGLHFDALQHHLCAAPCADDSSDSDARQLPFTYAMHGHRAAIGTTKVAARAIFVMHAQTC